MPLLPQTQSVVVVFPTAFPDPSDKDIESAVGSPIRQNSAGQLGQLGKGWSLADGTVVIVRPQGAGQKRIEVVDPFPSDVDHARAGAIALQLVPRRAGSPHSVGLNFVATVIDPPDNLLTQFVRLDQMAQVFGSKHTRLPNAQFLAPVWGGNLTIAFEEGKTGTGPRAVGAFTINANFSVATPTRAAVQQTLAAANLKRVDRNLRSLLTRLGV